MKEHIRDIENDKKDKVIGVHFNLKGHSLANLRLQIIEKVMPNNTNILLEREKNWIQTLQTNNAPPFDNRLKMSLIL